MLLFSSSPPQAGGVWTTQRDLAARGGIQGGAPGPQVRPELNLPPSVLPLPSPPLGASLTSPPPPPSAQQANQAQSVCHAAGGLGGRREEQAGRGPMWTSCPSETLPGSVSPSALRLITSLVFINAWGSLCPAGWINRGRTGEAEVEEEKTLNSNNNNNNIKPQQLEPSDPGVPHGSRASWFLPIEGCRAPGSVCPYVALRPPEAEENKHLRDGA